MEEKIIKLIFITTILLTFTGIEAFAEVEAVIINEEQKIEEITNTNERDDNTDVPEVFTVDNNTYKVLDLDEDNGVVMFMRCENLNDSQEIIISNQVTYNGHSFRVKYLYEKAFSNSNKNEKKIYINDDILGFCNLEGNLVEILRGTFANEKKLESVDFGNINYIFGEKCFQNCISITNVKMPNNMKIMEGYTFYKCSSLRSINLEKITKFNGQSSFANCSKLEYIGEINSELTELPDNTFQNCIKLRINSLNNIKKLGNECFKDCIVLNKNIVTNIEEIGDNCFWGCSFTEVYLKETKKVGYNAFGKCGALEKIRFGSSTIPELADEIVEESTVNEWIFPINYKTQHNYLDFLSKLKASKVIWNSNYENGRAAVTYKVKLNTLKSPSITREGYELEGWYKEPECINKVSMIADLAKVSGSDLVIKDPILYAKWISKQSREEETYPGETANDEEETNNSNNSEEHPKNDEEISDDNDSKESYNESEETNIQNNQEGDAENEGGINNSTNLEEETASNEEGDINDHIDLESEKADNKYPPNQEEDAENTDEVNNSSDLEESVDKTEESDISNSEKDSSSANVNDGSGLEKLDNSLEVSNSSKNQETLEDSEEISSTNDSEEHNYEVEESTYQSNSNNTTNLKENIFLANSNNIRGAKDSINNIIINVGGNAAEVDIKETSTLFLNNMRIRSLFMKSVDSDDIEVREFNWSSEDKSNIETKSINNGTLSKIIKNNQYVGIYLKSNENFKDSTIIELNIKGMITPNKVYSYNEELGKFILINSSLQIDYNTLKFKPTRKKEYLIIGLNLSEDSVAMQGWNKVFSQQSNALLSKDISDDVGWVYLQGEELCKGWIKDASDGNWYFLNDKGIMETGWLKDKNNKWYYLNTISDGSKGAMKIGWNKIDNEWYYLQNDGVLAEDTIIDGYIIGAGGKLI